MQHSNFTRPREKILFFWAFRVLSNVKKTSNALIDRRVDFQLRWSIELEPIFGATFLFIRKHTGSECPSGLYARLVSTPRWLWDSFPDQLFPIAFTRSHTPDFRYSSLSQQDIRRFSVYCFCCCCCCRCYCFYSSSNKSLHDVFLV